MKHRHLVDGVGYTAVAIEDILDRGKPVDWVALRDVIVGEPHGEVARIVLHVCETRHIYGASILWHDFVTKIQGESRGSLEASRPTS